MGHARTTRPDRLPWLRPAPDGRPSCPGCAREVELSQPDRKDPNRLLGVCNNPACSCWTFFHRLEGRWQVAERISAEDRRNPPWTPSRPATAETAGRA